jgi:stage II sporulation protein AA (anti-sigma F factor antagonist)
VKILHFIKDNTLYIQLQGELDSYAAANVKDTMDTILSQFNACMTVLDLQQLIFMDSTGLGVILGRYKKIKAMGNNVCISNPPIHIDKLLQLSGIYSIIPKIN